jgi:hypothetical protein
LAVRQNSTSLDRQSGRYQRGIIGTYTVHRHSLSRQLWTAWVFHERFDYLYNITAWHDSDREPKSGIVYCHDLPRFATISRMEYQLNDYYSSAYNDPNNHINHIIAHSSSPLTMPCCGCDVIPPPYAFRLAVQGSDGRPGSHNKALCASCCEESNSTKESSGRQQSSTSTSSSKGCSKRTAKHKWVSWELQLNGELVMRT